MKPSTAIVLRLLRERGSLTSLEALHLGGGSRLAARVADLKAAGFDVRAERVPGQSYTRYRLVETPPVPASALRGLVPDLTGGLSAEAYVRRIRETPDVRRAVLLRDGMCVLRITDFSHACYDAWGQPHAADDLDRLTLEHVKDKLRMGKRAPSDPSHLVALCGWRNAIRPPTKNERAWMREYLRRVAPEAAA